MNGLVKAAREYVELFDILNYPKTAAMYPANLKAALEQYDNNEDQDTCPCGHSDYEHVHYCSTDSEDGNCNCNQEYRRV